MATLELSLAADLRAFALDVELSLGAETLAVAGPSGAGKTSILRAIAGLLRPRRGRIVAGGRTWLDTERGVALRPEQRSVGLVPQEYALFPHLSVAQNVAFGGAADAPALMARLGIAHLAGDRPGRLSGGERQRVALARALARRPEVLLLDEPLAALDAQTRALVRDEIADVLAGLEVPAILVTHDFADAAALAGRVAVLVDGRLRQVGAVEELLHAPQDPFVAAFTGANVLRGLARGGVVALDGGGELPVPGAPDGRVAVAFQPWDAELAGSGEGLERTVTAVTGMGPRTRVRLGDVVADVPAGTGARRGDRAWIRVASGLVRAFAERR